MQVRALVAGILVGTTAVGCTGSPPSPAEVVEEPADVLFLRTAGGVTVLGTSPDGSAITLPRAVPSTDWSTVVGAVRRDNATEVVATDVLTAERVWSREVPGRLEVEVASSFGSMVALGSPDETTGYGRGRSTTTIVVVGQSSLRPRTFRLAGNFEPEAFSTDGLSLFVVQYLPARRPTRYRVRRLDLVTGSVEGVYSVDAHLQRAMRGTARIQAASPDGRRLYTLYTTAGTGGVEHAFIHVLSLDELWAHCVDLPPSFAAAPESSIAVAVAPDGAHVYVGDAAAGTVAEIGARSLEVTRTTHAEFGSRGGLAHAAAGPDGAVFLAKGTRLVALDASTLQAERTWDLEARITGLQAARDGTRLYVGSRDRILTVDPATGRTVSLPEAIDVGGIDQLGPSTRPLSKSRTTLRCAC